MKCVVPGGLPHELRRVEYGKPTLIIRSRERGGVVEATLAVELPSSEKLDLNLPNMGGYRDKTDTTAVDKGLASIVGPGYVESAKKDILMWQQRLVITPREAALVTSTEPVGQGSHSFIKQSWLEPIIAQANAKEGVAYGEVTDYFNPRAPYIERVGYQVSAPEQERSDVSEHIDYDTVDPDVLADIGSYLDLAATGLDSYQREVVDGQGNATPSAWVIAPLVTAIR